MKRKSVVLVVLAVVLLGLPLSALELSGGVLAGVSHSGYYGSDHRSYLQSVSFRDSLLMRLAAGLQLTLAFSDLLALQPELLVAGSGGRGASTSTPQEDSFREGFTYLTLPVLLRVSLPAGPGTVQLFVGPAAGLLLGKGSGTGESSGFEYSFPLDLNPLAVFAVAAAGYSLPALGGALSLQIRSTLGLTRSYDPALADDHRTWSLGLLAGYAVPIPTRSR